LREESFVEHPSIPHLDELDSLLKLFAEEAPQYLHSLPDRPVRNARADEVAESFHGDLPEHGVGAEATLRALWDGLDATIASAGPRFFHFVIGGSTPAALAADWTTSTLDQNNGAWVSSPLAAQLEVLSIKWLKQLFGLPESWGGVLTSGATMANFTALACARRWWGLEHGRDIEADGWGDLPDTPVFSSGYIHPSSTKALAMLGVGRSSAQLLTRDAAGRLDLDALEATLENLGGAPAIVIANAGEVNAGDFDPVSKMADLCEKYNAWLHVDGAFGLFAAVSERTNHLTAGVERANSVISDGHKWLNVPYDCGFAFVRDPALLAGVFSVTAAYLPSADDPRPVFFNLGPESSRRSRSLAVWATLNAYGRSGYREMVERQLDLALRIAQPARPRRSSTS
jgi:glutamate/tyrosine decarboxylase-like PLP-dependent enzyme